MKCRGSVARWQERATEWLVISWRRVLTGVAGCGVALAVWAFFLPWFSVNPMFARVGGRTGRGDIALTVKRNGKTVTGRLSDVATLPTDLRGVDVPRLAMRGDLQAGLAVWELVGGTSAIDRRIQLVYLAPGIAAVLGVMLLGAGREPRLLWFVGATAIVMALVINRTLDLTARGPVAAKMLTIAYGLWLTYAAYAIIGVASLGAAFLSQRKPSG